MIISPLQNTIVNKLKSIKARGTLYPSIVAVFILIVVICFTFAAQFLSENLNKAFVVDEQSIDETLVKIDLENYYLVAKKAGITIVVPNPEPTPPLNPGPASPESPRGTEESSPTTLAPSAPSDGGESNPSPIITPVEQALLNIRVLNSTSKQGLAGDLKNDLINAGFLTVSTGNSPPAKPMTLISIKNGRVSAELVAELKQIVSQKYDVGEIGTLAEDDAFDVRIVI